MTATLLTKASIAAIVLILLILVTGKRIIRYKALLALFLVAFFADNLLIVLTNAYPALQVIPNRVWDGFLICNWSGKLYSIIFTLTLVYFTRRILTREEVGLKLRQKKGSVVPSAIIVLALAVWATLIGFSSPKGPFDPLTLIYLAIMPALNEELVYRGYLQGILSKIMQPKINLFGAWIGWGTILASMASGLITTCPFIST
jgi:membrane protease YdiL (CAAX protease family)